MGRAEERGPHHREERTLGPVLRVVRGRPTADELAALVVVLAARSAAASDVDSPRPRSGWADPARRLRAAVRPGPDAWRRSALPG